MPAYKDIAKLSPLPIVNLQAIGVPAPGILIETPQICRQKFGGGECEAHYAALAARPDRNGALTQCPFGLATIVVQTPTCHVALTSFVPYPRLGGSEERVVAKKYPGNKIASSAAARSAEGLNSTIRHFENLEKDSLKRYAVALHEIRKLNRTVKQTAERLCLESSPGNPNGADPRYVSIWKSAEMMSQQFDVFELLANEGLSHLPLTSDCEIYRMFDKCVRIFDADHPGRIIKKPPYGYSAVIRACDKTVSIIPTVLIENALKYSIEGLRWTPLSRPENVFS